jgi:hypothetical protein
MPEETRSSDWKEHALAFVDPKHGLWQVIHSPLIAAVHFTICYIATSVFCIRSDSGDLADVNLVLGGLTVAAVAAIGFHAWGAWRRLRLVGRSTEGRAKRRREVEFLARITLYLAHLSWVGVLFVASPLVFFGVCA